MNKVTATTGKKDQWVSLYKIGGVVGFGMLGIMLAQIIIFIVWPPPTTVPGFFQLFQESKLLGLLSLDLLYIVNNTLLVIFYLALSFSLKDRYPSAILIALVLGILGVSAYYGSNTAFEMLSLSTQFQAATSETQHNILLAAGQAMLETYRGTSFDVYYVLNAIALLLFAFVMLNTRIFSRVTAIFGVVAGILMAIPSTAGTIGLVFSLASLIPWAIFSVLVALHLFKMEKSLDQ